MTWNDAVDYCANLNEDGYSDWRLPNIDELKTLMGNAQSKLGDTGYFWSSSVRSDDNAWHVYFYYGVVSSDNKSLPISVRCVR